MKFIRQFLTFWYHFIIGDDWRIAFGVVIGLTGTAVLTHRHHLQIWWLLPGLVVIMLSLSLWAATVQRKR